MMRLWVSGSTVIEPNGRLVEEKTSDLRRTNAIPFGDLVDGSQDGEEYHKADSNE
jgi:hypothetical protein